VKLICALCKVQACDQSPGARDLPGYCVMLEKDKEIEALLRQARQAYLTEGESRTLAMAAARTEAAGYLRWPRVQEVMDFAWRIKANHLGIASCIGLIEEARILHKLLETNGFQVSSVCCKVGMISKTEVGLTPDETLRPEGFDPLCNPIGQAELLNAIRTDLNILVGLCVGHDTLFLRHTRAPATVLVAKDRVTGHNPAAALYTSHSYYERLGHWRADRDNQ
jgi:uncharacterized metal-binding protein